MLSDFRKKYECKKLKAAGGKAVVCRGTIEYWLPRLKSEGILFDAEFSDPPYGLAFMGRHWDSNGVAFNVTTWKSIHSLLKPGALCLNFGGTRTYHRMMVAIEDAGFSLLDTLSWCYGAGYPKGLDVGKSVDRKLGKDREAPGRKVPKGKRPEDVPATPEGAAWDGYNTELKPAWEPLPLFAREPFADTYAEQALKHACGLMNVRACRVGDSHIVVRGGGGKVYAGGKSAYATAEVNAERVGRYPANMVLSHHPLCSPGRCHHACPIRMIDVSAGFAAAKGVQTYLRGTDAEKAKLFAGKANREGPYADADGPARFFLQTSPMRMIYQAKASRSERDAGLAGKARSTYGLNDHECVKPIDLCRYLALLLLPPPRKKPRRLLVPFSGSGSEMIGALLAGWDEVYGIETEPDHARKAVARLNHWCK